MQFLHQTGLLSGSRNNQRVFEALSYSGSLSEQTLSFGFQPDMVWIKENSTATGRLFDRSGTNQPLDMNGATGRLTAVSGVAFNSNGLIIPADTANISANGQTYRAYAFKEYAGHDLSGFEIVTYTGDGTGARSITLSGSFTYNMVLFRRTDGTLSVTGGQTPYVMHNDFGSELIREMGGDLATSTMIVGGAGAAVQVASALNVTGNSLIGYNLRGTISGFYTGNGTSQTILGADMFAFTRSTTEQIRFVMIKKFGATDAICFDYTQGYSGITQGVRPFSALAHTSGSNVTLGIDGFTLNDGDTEYNLNATVYGFVAYT